MTLLRGTTLAAPPALNGVDFGPALPFLHRLRTNQPVKVMIASSSSTSGYLHPSGSNTTEAPAAGNYQAELTGAGRQMWSQLATRYGNTNVTTVNIGRVGAMARDWLNGGQETRITALRQALAENNPDAVLIQLNTNDASTPWELTAAAFETLLRTLYREAKRHGAAVFAIPPYTHTQPSTNVAEYTQYPAACYRAAAAEGVIVIPIEATLQGATFGSSKTGSTYDGTHPTLPGAAELGAAFAAAFPNPTLLKVTVGAERTPRGDWTDPRRTAGLYQWVTANGQDRRHHAPPVFDLDGYPVTAVSPYVGSGLMLRDSVFMSDCVQGSDVAALPNLAGGGPDGWLGHVKATTTDHPTWVAGGGLGFDGTKFATIPLDPQLKRDLVPGIMPFTVRIVISGAAAGTNNVIARRGDSGPFAMFTDGALTNVVNVYSRTSLGTPPLSSTYVNTPHDLLFTCYHGAGGGNISGRLYDNGVLLGTLTVPTTDYTVGRDFNWVLGGRYGGANQAAATPVRQYNGRLHWVDIARSYVQAPEAAALYASLKTKLNAERALALP